MNSRIDPVKGFESIVANTMDGLVAADSRGRIILFNPAAERMFGRSADAVLNESLECLMPAGYRAGHGGHISGYFARNQKSDLLGKPRRMVGLRADGSEFPIELSLAQEASADEPFVLAFIRDISAREEAEHTLQDIKRRYERAVNGSRDGIWDWDLKTNKVYYAPRWKELLGVDGRSISNSPDEWFSRVVSSSLTGFHDKLTAHLEGRTDALDVELEMQHDDGTVRWMLCRGIASRDASGKAASLSGSMADITELKCTQQELQRVGQHDRLTGLANRAVLSASIERSIARTQDDAGHSYAVLFFDFDRFKVVNDGLGHNVGDALLVSIADRFRQHVRNSDTVSRFGGDEFVVLLDGVGHLDTVKQISSKLLTAFAQPHQVNGYEIVSTASIGVATSDQGYETPDEVIRDADAAMYHAKSSGKNNYRLFDAAMHARAIDQIGLERDLRRTPFEDQFKLAYQPIISLESGRVAGFEALLRWEHPERGLLMPDQFIDIAEETGLIIPLGEYVLRSACQQIAHWRSSLGAGEPLFVNVNLSKRQLAHPGLIDILQEVVGQTGVDPADLKLEVTEAAIMDNRHSMIPKMNQIHEIGIHLAMDDFGTGQSSLSCLHHFPIDVLKIDRSFIINMEQHRPFAAVVQSIILLAQNMNMQVVAEGVDNWGQLAQLQAMDCAFAQGYLFARPLPADQATGYLGRKIEKHVQS